MKRVSVTPANSGKRVGASVAVPGEQSFFPGNDCQFGVPSFPLPFPPAPFPPINPGGITGPPGPTGPPGRIEDVGASANVLSQLIPASSTVPVALNGVNFSSGGSTVSGNTITLPRAGKYLVTVSITASRPAGVDGNLTFNLSGGVVGAGTALDGYNLASGETGVFTGNMIVSTSGATSVSLTVTNAGANTVTISGGVFAVQLLA